MSVGRREWKSDIVDTRDLALKSYPKDYKSHRSHQITLKIQFGINDSDCNRTKDPREGTAY